MTERRFNDQEVAEIIDRATRAQTAALSQPSSVDGVTLAQLQEIGREVGIAPEAIASAARSLDLGDRRTVRHLLGIPVGVGLTANLGRQLSEQEWQRLVVDLRETFDARGRVREEGAFRQWSNGNLQVMVEPTAEGNQVRLRTFKSEGPIYIGMGLGLVALAAISFVAKVMGGADTAPMMQKFLPVAFLGAALATFGAITLPRWARERRAQMESVVARLRSTS